MEKEMMNILFYDAGNLTQIGSIHIFIFLPACVPTCWSTSARAMALNSL